MAGLGKTACSEWRGMVLLIHVTGIYTIMLMILTAPIAQWLERMD